MEGNALRGETGTLADDLLRSVVACPMDGNSWTGYWRTGPLHASTMEFTADARSRITRRWNSLFEDLPSGSSILDIGTGAGSVLALAAQSTNNGHRLTAVGVDLAEIEPKRNTAWPSTPYCDIDFKGGISADQLPFEDRSFSIVTSQFAIEYSDFERALGEACRVSADRFVALIHARDGVVVRQNRPIADQIAWLSGELKLIEKLADHVRGPTPDTATHLTRAAEAIRKKGASLENPSFLEGLSQNIGRYLQRHAQYSPAENETLLADFADHLESHAGIMSALANAARTADEIQDASRLLSTSGMESVVVEEQRSNDDRHLVGYWLIAARES